LLAYFYESKTCNQRYGTTLSSGCSCHHRAPRVQGDRWRSPHRAQPDADVLGTGSRRPTRCMSPLSKFNLIGYRNLLTGRSHQRSIYLALVFQRNRTKVIFNWWRSEAHDPLRASALSFLFLSRYHLSDFRRHRVFPQVFESTWYRCIRRWEEKGAGRMRAKSMWDG